jgi:hypothetical protein
MIKYNIFKVGLIITSFGALKFISNKINNYRIKKFIERDVQSKKAKSEENYYL